MRKDIDKAPSNRITGSDATSETNVCIYLSVGQSDVRDVFMTNQLFTKQLDKPNILAYGRIYKLLRQQILYVLTLLVGFTDVRHTYSIYVVHSS